MGLQEECLIVCVPPFCTPEPDRVMDVAGVIIAYGQYLERVMNQFMSVKPPMAPLDDLETLAGIVDQLTNELAGVTSALAIINAYERAIVFARALEVRVFTEDDKATDDSEEEEDAMFDEIKTTMIVPFVPTCARDVHLMDEIHQSSAERVAYVMGLVEKAKAT